MRLKAPNSEIIPERLKSAQNNGLSFSRFCFLLEIELNFDILFEYLEAETKYLNTQIRYVLVFTVAYSRKRVATWAKGRGSSSGTYFPDNIGTYVVYD